MSNTCCKSCPVCLHQKEELTEYFAWIAFLESSEPSEQHVRSATYHDVCRTMFCRLLFMLKLASLPPKRDDKLCKRTQADTEARVRQNHMDIKSSHGHKVPSSGVIWVDAERLEWRCLHDRRATQSF